MLKQGGNFYRVHPCKMSHVQAVDIPGFEVEQSAPSVNVSTEITPEEVAVGPEICSESGVGNESSADVLGDDLSSSIDSSSPNFVTVYSKDDLP